MQRGVAYSDGNFEVRINGHIQTENNILWEPEEQIFNMTEDEGQELTSTPLQS